MLTLRFNIGRITMDVGGFGCIHQLRLDMWFRSPITCNASSILRLRWTGSSTLLCPAGTDRNRLVPSGSKRFRPDSKRFWPDSDRNQLDSDRNRLELVGIWSEPVGTNRFQPVPIGTKWNNHFSLNGAKQNNSNTYIIIMYYILEKEYI